VESEPNPSPTGVLTQIKQLVSTGLSALQNRGELFLLELEEEKTHAMELLVWAMAVGLLGLMFLIVFTGLIIYLFPPPLRIWAILGFCILYAVGALLALLNLKSILKAGAPPFAGSVDEMKKDREWLESSK
jgi:uncharacterized membrane protein YqjE